MKNLNPNIAIVTDSVSQVPPKIARELGITVIPLTVNIDGKPYLDGVDLRLSELYCRMRLEKIQPTTNSTSPEQFASAYRERLLAGAKGLLCITLASKLSSCYDMACTAAAEVRAEYPDREIEVLDSKRAAIAEGFVVMVAARVAAKGKTLPLVLQSAREACHRSSIAITLETLEYLARGGRIGKVAYLLSSLINIKPILTINNEGSVVSIGKARSINHALQAIVDYATQQIKGCKKVYVAIMEADAAKHAARLKDLVIQKLHPTKIMHTDFTPVMGVHAGPGAVGLGFYYE